MKYLLVILLFAANLLAETLTFAMYKITLPDAILYMKIQEQNKCSFVINPETQSNLDLIKILEPCSWIRSGDILTTNVNGIELYWLIGNSANIYLVTSKDILTGEAFMAVRDDTCSITY